MHSHRCGPPRDIACNRKRRTYMRRHFNSAVHANDLAELQGLLASGAVALPCLVAIKHSLASTTQPIQSSLGKKPSVMVMTTKYVETFDPRPDRANHSVR